MSVVRGLFYRCPYYLSGPFMIVLLLSMKGQKALVFHQKYLNCVKKMNKGLTGLKRHEGEKLMMEFSFLGELSL